MKDAITHAWLRRVSDYHSGGVSAAEGAAVEAHLAECIQCQQALTAYQRFYTLARSPLRLDHGAPVALAGYRPAPLQREFTNSTADSHRDVRRAAPGSHRPPTPLSTLGAIAAAVLIAILAGLLLALHGAQPASPHPHPTPTPTTDPATQAYVQVLRTYYPPFAGAEQQEWDQCALPIRFNDPPQVLAPCRPVEQAAISAAQALLDHLTMTPATARWQAQDAKFKQALQATIAYNRERIQDIDAGNVLQFYETRDAGDAAAGLLCNAVVQIDDGPPPLVPGFPPPDYALNPTQSGCLQP